MTLDCGWFVTLSGLITEQLILLSAFMTVGVVLGWFARMVWVR